MFRHWTQTIILCIFGLFSLTTQAALESYVIDPTHSFVLWHINHFGFSTPTGKWYATGTLQLDEEKPQNSKVNVTINIKDIDTGLPKLDQHLLSPDFFEADKFPTATFDSNRVDITSKDTATIHGTLTVRDISKPVLLKVKLNKIGTSPITQKKTAGFSATTTVKRSDFGMSKYLPGLSDEVKLEIDIEAYKKP